MRITPAYAGRTILLKFVITTNKDHPRIRGKNGATAMSPAVTMGITPAYAGRTSQIPLRYSVIEDHPRIRGKNGHNLKCIF